MVGGSVEKVNSPATFGVTNYAVKRAGIPGTRTSGRVDRLRPCPGSFSKTDTKDLPRNETMSDFAYCRKHDTMFDPATSQGETHLACGPLVQEDDEEHVSTSYDVAVKGSFDGDDPYPPYDAKTQVGTLAGPYISPSQTVMYLAEALENLTERVMELDRKIEAIQNGDDAIQVAEEGVTVRRKFGFDAKAKTIILDVTTFTDDEPQTLEVDCA